MYRRIFSLSLFLVLLFSCGEKEKVDPRVEVSSITLNVFSLSLVEGESYTLTATVSPSNATDKTVTWTSSNTSVATVNGGTVTAVKEGVAAITANCGGKTAACSVSVSKKAISVSSVTLNKTSLTLVEGDTFTLTATVSPSNATDKTVTWTSSNTSVATVNGGTVTAVKEGVATIKVTTQNGGNTAQCVVTVVNDTKMEAVDLGLSVKWATTNLGATKPEEYGDYYAWGETEPYYSSLDPLTWKDGKEEGYWWSSYKWCMGSEYTFTKYCTDSFFGYNGFTDGKTILDPEDDAAKVNLGGKWRMPTDAEWMELSNKCTWTWTDQNGVGGCRVTAGNGNSIFLPAGGKRHKCSPEDVGSLGFYWSSSLHMYGPLVAWGVYFGQYIYWRDLGRYYGFSVRPVYAE